MLDLEIRELEEARKEQKQAKRRDKQVHGSGKKGRKARQIKKASDRVIHEKKNKEVKRAKRQASSKKERDTFKQSRAEEDKVPKAKAEEDEGPMQIRGGAGNRGSQQMMQRFLTKEVKAHPTEVPGSVRFDCPYKCGRKFESKQGLAIHVATKHEAKGHKMKKATKDGKVKLVVTTPGGSRKSLTASELRARGIDLPPPSVMCPVVHLSDSDSMTSNETPRKRPNLGAAKSALKSDKTGSQASDGKLMFCSVFLLQILLTIESIFALVCQPNLP